MIFFFFNANKRQYFHMSVLPINHSKIGDRNRKKLNIVPIYLQEFHSQASYLYIMA